MELLESSSSKNILSKENNNDSDKQAYKNFDSGHGFDDTYVGYGNLRLGEQSGQQFSVQI